MPRVKGVREMQRVMTIEVWQDSDGSLSRFSEVQLDSVKLSDGFGKACNLIDEMNERFNKRLYS